mgnify:CR=1 FL=1
MHREVLEVKVLYLKESSTMHSPSFEHPEKPWRATMVYKTTLSTQASIREVSVQSVSMSEALRVAKEIHARGYVDYLLRLSQSAPALVDEDTFVEKDSLELALAALFYSYRTSREAKTHPVFIILRPPGHHAGKGGKAMGAPTQGFCLLNNAAAAVKGFMDEGFKKVATLDFDVHHGNGTMEIFYRDRILQVDFHQDPDTLYPHTGYPFQMGEGEGYGYKANIVLPPRSGDDLFVKVLDLAMNVIKSYNPDSLVVSAGFDAFQGDGLADLELTEASYYALGKNIRELRVPTIIVLEGGYGVGLERGVRAFLEGLIGVEKHYPPQTRSPPALYRKALETAERVLAKVAEKSKA